MGWYHLWLISITGNRFAWRFPHNLNKSNAIFSVIHHEIRFFSIETQCEWEIPILSRQRNESRLIATHVSSWGHWGKNAYLVYREIIQTLNGHCASIPTSYVSVGSRLKQSISQRTFSLIYFTCAQHHRPSIIRLYLLTSCSHPKVFAQISA